ncbi:single-stranded-DNA-specific exonuclease RecJ [Dolosicoccus paucivorans]|uniref:single-stranded-DNA-specific exonuclease RecJ n=1 Tax=Dolosicoccus paucivorans TaxID=84521 RepID=UPI00088CEDEC|nr:single-stranded-DNA-specific exonuclease RecJ [Dolosicoccus paucivorans]SDI31382.1 single-stranded-DNA-specific exonuclease [Dolosicoccus paucivorans]
MKNLARYQWQNPQLPEDTTTLIKQLQEAGLNYSPAFLRVCIARGLTTKEAIEIATDETPQLFHDAFLMYDMEKATQRIMTAIQEGERILVYGDYDADGITSTLIVVEALESLGADVIYHLPNRFTDGYGPNLKQYQHYVEEENVRLIITVDNGVAGFEAIEWAQSHDVDVIVTDHHEIQEELPPSYAFVHPQHPKGEYPFSDLAGAGVALKLVTALLEDVPPEALELAAIGTIADMVSLTDENRTIVLAGLSIMKQTPRIGLALLFQQENIETTNLDADTIGFQVGPRLNALGRLEDPTPALELLQTDDEVQAQQLLTLINDVNQRRKDIVEEIVQQIDKQLKDLPTLPNIIVLSNPSWPAGVLGIVAGRITNKYHRPSIMFQQLDDEQIFKGSARSIPAVNIFELLSLVKDHILYFGGHAQAAGMTVAADEFDRFKQALEEVAMTYEEQIHQPETLKVDLVAKLQEINLDFIEEIQQLGPFGMHNPKPNVLINEAILATKQYVGINRQHVKFNLVDEDNDDLDGIAFSQADRFNLLNQGQKVDMVGQLSINEWQGKRTPQLMLEDLGIDDIQWIDQRSSQIPADFFHRSQAVYLFKTPKLLKTYQSTIPETSQSFLYSDEVVDLLNKKYLVFVEPPESIELAREWIDRFEGSQIIVGTFVHQSKYLIGAPTRKEFATVYRWLENQEPFVLAKELSKLAQQFKIEVPKLITIFHVFLQANFVTIDEGRVVFQHPTTQAVDLTQFPAMVAYMDEMKAEKLFVYSDFQQLVNYFISK